MKKILIDTDVILDFFFDRKPFSDYSTQLLCLCERGLLEGFVTPVIISNTYYLLRRTAKHEKVVEKLKQLLLLINVLQMDRLIVDEALNSEFKDFKDALQNYSALNHGAIDVIVTRNVKDYKKSEVGALTPEIFLKLMALQE